MNVDIIEYEYNFNNEYLYDVILDDNTRIETVVTQDPTRVTAWINDTESSNDSRLYRLLVGLDIEWRPTFNAAVQNPIATLQLCVGKSCLIYQIFHSPEIPDRLRQFLLNKDYRFVGVGIDCDVEKLWYNCGLQVSNPVDLCQWAAAELKKENLRNVGLKALVKEIVGKEIEKPQKVRISRWDQRRLSYEQISYACLDAYLSFEVGRLLTSWY